MTPGSAHAMGGYMLLHVLLKCKHDTKWKTDFGVLFRLHVNGCILLCSLKWQERSRPDYLNSPLKGLAQVKRT